MRSPRGYQPLTDQSSNERPRHRGDRLDIARASLADHRSIMLGCKAVPRTDDADILLGESLSFFHRTHDIDRWALLERGLFGGDRSVADAAEASPHQLRHHDELAKLRRLVGKGRIRPA